MNRDYGGQPMYTREERTYPGNEEGFDRRREMEWNQNVAQNNIPRNIGIEYSWKDVDQRRAGFEPPERFDARRRSPVRPRSPIHRRSPYRDQRSDWKNSPPRRGGSPGFDQPRSDRYDNRRRSPPRERNWERGASSSVVLQRVPESITEDDVCEEVKRFGAPIVVVRIEYEQGPRGTSDRICVVEFQRTADAIGWMKKNEGFLWLKRERITMEYYNSTRRDDDFRERDHDRERDFPPRRGKSEPSNTMIVKGLLTTTTEESIRKSFEYITQFPVVAVRLVRHKLGVSRGFCFVEWKSTEECTQVIKYLQSATPRFHIDGRHVTLDYSTPQGQSRPPGVQHSNSTANIAGQVAEAAIQAAQWSKREQERKDSERLKEPQKPTTSVQPKFNSQKVEKPHGGPISYQPGQYPIPDTTKYRYDSTSGFYYDNHTGFYYDAKSRYFYNSKTQKYLYWDLNKRDYLPVNGDQPKVDERKEREEKKDKEQKSVNAKKIAKDMERWAKAQNKKKDEVKRTFDENPTLPTPAPSTQVTHIRKDSSSADAAYKLLESQTNEIERQAAVQAAYRNDQFKKPDALSTRKPATSSDNQQGGAGLVSYQEDSDEEPVQEEEEEDEEKFLDWNKLACLLCRRGFSNKEMLVKHVDLSDLHRTNLEKRRKSKMGSLIPRKTESSEAPLKYRDRAAERRKNYGTTAPLKRNQMGGRRDPVPFEQPTKDGLDETNIGNQMLQRMGWNKGRGLGKSQDGIVDPIRVQQRSRGSGLGMRGSTYGLDGSEGDYRTAAKRITYARFQESD